MPEAASTCQRYWAIPERIEIFCDGHFPDTWHLTPSFHLAYFTEQPYGRVAGVLIGFPAIASCRASET